MVQAHPNLSITLKNLATLGAVVSAEQDAALDHSLPIKRVETGLKTLTLWGKITAQNGKDYLVAEGYNEPLVQGGRVLFDAKYFYSQDGVKWVDLQAVDQQTAERASQIRSMLSGDPSKVYEISEDDPSQPDAPLGEDGQPMPEQAGAKKLVFQVPELAVLRLMIDCINAECGVTPANALQVDALNHLVPNKLFSSTPFPEKLESYVHRTVAPGGPTLAQDLRGTWSLHYDPFKFTATLRSLLYPGYFFYYNAYQATWGSLYCGDGVRNHDLIFML